MQSSFHINASEISMLSSRCLASSVPDRANVIIATSGDGAGTKIISGKISTDNDVWHDSLIVRFNTAGNKEEAAAHAALIVPLKAGEEPQEAVPSLLFENGIATVSFRFGDTSIKASFNDTEVDIKED